MAESLIWIPAPLVKTCIFAFDGSEAQVPGLASIEATARGFVLKPHDGRAVVVLAPPIDGDQASLVALLSDGAAWSTSALALALRASQGTIESNRVVTGVTWVDGELWHGTWEGDESDIRRIDPESGTVFERLQMPSGTGVSGLESALGLAGEACQP